MKHLLAVIALSVSPLLLTAQTAVVNKQHAFPDGVPAGNYSGITWLGDNQYAVVDDKSVMAGFYLMTIDIDSITGNILNVRADRFVSSENPNRDEEGICYVPQTNTVFVSGERDGKIIEYAMNGMLTDRQLSIPEEFQSAHANGGLEALTYDANARLFWTTSENTLQADGPMPTIHHKVSNLLRLQSFGYDLQPKTQYWYETDRSLVEKEKGKSLLGVSGLAALPDGRLVVLEREIYQAPKSVGSFVHVKLYLVHPAVQQPGELLPKRLLTEFRTKINLTARSFANYEGICVGKPMADGRMVLVLVADSQNQHKGYLKDWFRTVIISE